MKKERLLLLLGLFVSFVFFYLGLNEWLKTREEKVQPPSVVVNPPTQPPSEAPQKTEKPQEEKPVELTNKTSEKERKPQNLTQKKEESTKEAKKEEKGDAVAQKIKEESVAKKVEEPKVKKAELKLYIVQVGAFKDKEKAENVMEIAKKMGYETKIVEEDDFYKVRLSVRTDNINSELNKIRETFGNAFIKQ